MMGITIQSLDMIHNSLKFPYEVEIYFQYSDDLHDFYIYFGKLIQQDQFKYPNLPKHHQE